MDFVKNNILLIAVAFASGAMLLWPVFRRNAGGPWVSTLEATQLINRSDALVLDVREPGEFAQGHIIGARSVPLGDLERRAPELAKNKAKPIIVHCERGNRSAHALHMLRKHGYTEVYNLTGGYAAWQGAGLPTEK